MKRRTFGLIGAGLVGAAIALALLGNALGQSAPQPGQAFGPGNGPGMMGGYGPGARGYGPGMMGGYGQAGPGGSGSPYGPGYGPGMMGGYGPGTGGYGPGMMGGVWQSNPSGHPLTSIDDARQAFQGYIDATGNADFVLNEIMQFQYNFYAIVNEKSTGHGAFELLADPQTGAVFPEFGPNMMWNTKYGHMTWWWGQQPGDPTISAEQAPQIAQQWLDQYQPGSTSEATPDIFPGYYTLHILNDGSITGMLSVDAYTGQVWYHSWHGAFIAMSGGTSS